MDELSDEIAAILEANGWRDVGLLARTGTSFVYSAGHPRTYAKLAVKVLSPGLADEHLVFPRDETAWGTVEFRAMFRAEVEAHATLWSPHVPAVVDSGELSVEGSVVPFLATPLVPGAKNLYEFCAGLEGSPREVGASLLRVLTDVFEGLRSLHGNDLLHRDVSGRNVLVDGDGRAFLIDLGGVKRIELDTDGHTFGVQATEYLHPELSAFLHELESDSLLPPFRYVFLPRELLAEKGVAFDLYAAGITIEKSLAALNAALSSSAADFLRLLARRLKSSGTRESPRYDAVDEVLEDIARLDRDLKVVLGVPEMSAASSGSLRITPRLSVPITPAVHSIIAHPMFRRLKNVRQLALASEIYPSALHSRFEHSLGVYYWARQYLGALWQDPDDAYVRQVATPVTIRALLVAALLHDLAQYPFAHAAEGVHGRFSHEKLTVLLLDRGAAEREALGPEIVTLADDLVGEIDRHFAPMRTEHVLRVIQTHPGEERLRSAAPFDEKLRRVFHDVIDGPLDADKMDYTMRDAWSAGLTASHPGEDDLFLRALTVSGSRQALALRASGRDFAESLVLLRYRLFKWVYWHRKVRAIETLVATVIDRLMMAADDPEEWRWRFLRHSLTTDETGALQWLTREIESCDLVTNDFATALRGVEGGRLPKRILTISHLPSAMHAELRYSNETYEHLIRLKGEWCGGQRAGLERVLLEFHQRMEHLAGRRLSGADVLLDVPVPQRHKVGEVRIRVHSGEEVSLNQVSHVWRGVPEDFEDVARRIRVFVAPGLEGEFHSSDVLRALVEITS